MDRITGGERARVLIVDDSTGDLEILAASLDAQYDLLTATDGSRALELAVSARPDAILLDVLMPGIDGYETCRRLKAAPLTRDIPVVFITALDDREDESRGLELGAADYVTKPINAPIVRARVRHLVELKRARDMLLHLAQSDSLTGLANRRAFDETLAAEGRRLARSRERLAVIMLDIDHFKQSNDTYGHLAGNECLRRVAGAIGAAMRRSSDVAARYGGEEFACILPDTEPEGACSVAQRIVAGISSLGIPHEPSPVGLYVTASLGVASAVCDPAVDPTTIVAAAAERLYRAKPEGRNRVVA